MGKAKMSLRVAALASATAMVLAACGGGSSGGGSNGSSGSNGKPVAGGTLTFLTHAQQFDNLDPQRVYTGEDLNFISAYIDRTLTAYKTSENAEESSKIVPDAATDLGTALNGGKDWEFTVRSGMKWQDGSPVTCEDFKYGVSRTFATDVIVNGPTYAIQYLDIPQNKDGSSVYKGPYVTKDNNVAAFDKAVVCDGSKITFHLNKPIGDFNYTVALGMGAVPKAADKGEAYTKSPLSDGPYKIQTYTKGDQLILVRNENWSKAVDSIRPAYPDKIVVKFGLDAAVIDQRMIADAGADQMAISRDRLQTASVTQVFTDPRFADRRTQGFSPYSDYYNVNVLKVPLLKQRMALAAALDRTSVRQVYGGTYAGSLGDGVVKPNLAIDYAPSGMWTGLLGKAIPDSGDPAYAKQLIAESGKPMVPITFSYPQNADHDKEAAAVQASLTKAGIKVKLQPVESSAYYPGIQNKDRATELMWNGWGPDWPNASTIIPNLFTPNGGWDVSYVDDKAFTDKALAGLSETDRAKQAQVWKDLNKEAMQQVWVIPTLFEQAQRLSGSKVKSASGKNGTPYIGGFAGSWPYSDLYVEK